MTSNYMVGPQGGERHLTLILPITENKNLLQNTSGEEQQSLANIMQLIGSLTKAPTHHSWEYGAGLGTKEKRIMLSEFSRHTVPILQLVPCLYTLSIEPTSNKTMMTDVLELHLFRIYV
jgi:hypothetical protein